MSEEIIKVLDAVCAKFGVVIDWSAENVLPYVTQLTEKFIKWELGTSIAWVVIIGITLAVCALMWRILLPMAREHKWDPDYFLVFACGLFMIATCVFVVVFLATLCVQTMDIVTCCTFPEKAILDYAMSLMNK